MHQENEARLLILLERIAIALEDNANLIEDIKVAGITVYPGKDFEEN